MESDCACSSAAESACPSEHNQNSCCSIEKQPVSCCYDEELNLKYEDKNQIPSPVTKLTAPQELLLLKQNIELEEAIMSMEIKPFEEERPPPKVPLYLSNNNFTFYG